MSRSIYTWIGLFVVASNHYLTKLIANAHNAKEFKDGIIVIQSVFLQFFGMLIYHCQSQCRYAFAFHCKDGQSDIKKGK